MSDDKLREMEEKLCIIAETGALLEAQCRAFLINDEKEAILRADIENCKAAILAMFDKEREATSELLAADIEYDTAKFADRNGGEGLRYATACIERKNAIEKARGE